MQHLIGVQPTCDMVLEIWPPAFQCYNLIVPNLLNLPQSILGVGCVRKDLIPLSMYASSRANGCAYCSSHCCSYAVRRGVDPSQIKTLLEEFHQEGEQGHGAINAEEKKDTSLDPVQKAVVKLSYGLGTVPCTLTPDNVKEIFKVLPSESDVEWIVAAATMFGAFNKLMDGLGIPLEQKTYAETVNLMDSNYSLGAAGSFIQSNRSAGKSQTSTLLQKSSLLPVIDDWTLKLVCIYEGLRPGGALQLDRQLHGETPWTATECMACLENLTGQSFPIISSLQHVRFYRTITSVLIKNCDDRFSAGLGLRRKVLVGLKYAEILENDRLKAELHVIARTIGISNTNNNENTQITELVLKIGEALSYTPSRVTPELVQQIENEEELKPAMLVELVSFLAALQMLHRVESFDDARRRAVRNDEEKT